MASDGWGLLSAVGHDRDCDHDADTGPDEAEGTEGEEDE